MNQSFWELCFAIALVNVQANGKKEGDILYCGFFRKIALYDYSKYRL